MHEGTILYEPWHKMPQLQVRELAGVRVGPRVARPYVVEIWAEKTTVNDVLMPLARQYGLNVVTASGEISAIACRRALDRAIDAARPIRILYVSDFDPAGMGMPVSMARKVEYEIDRRLADVDIQVRPIVLTHDQCIDNRLPRTPIKETEKRGAHFEKRFGEGATELDALEALHPGELRRILEREIRRYWNPNHDDIVDDAWSDFRALLREINETVRAQFADELNALDKELQRFNKRLTKTRQKARELFGRMQQQLEEEQPNLEPPVIEFEADEDPDPLYDSRRGYLDQLQAYKRFQGKSPLPNGEDEDSPHS